MNVFIDYTGTGHRTRAIEGELGKRLNNGENSESGKLESVSWEESGVVIRTKYLTAIVGDNFDVDFYDDKGKPLSLVYRGGRKRNDAPSQAALQLLAKEGHDASGKAGGDYRVQEIRSFDPKDCVYGLGDKAGVLNKRHYEYEMWNSDIPDPHEDNFKSLYKSIPFMLVSKEKGAYGIFFDNHNKTYFDLGKESDAYYVFGADSGNLDYYFI
ncbi:MAG: alpha-glucosidase, partial [Lachnospiraceae bacterium]|nr:alpha-glucosidase [Lachnospiraceae bacterium]